MKEVSYFNVLGEKIKVKDADARERIDNTNSNIEQIKANINSNIEQIKENIYANYSKDKSEIIVMGDSISQGWLDTGTYSENAPWKILGAKLNKNVHNYGVNASGYTIVNNSFISQAYRAIDDSTYDHDKVFAIFVIGGINDLNNDNASYDNIRNNRDILIETLSSHFKGVPIYIIPTYSSNTLNVDREYKLSSLTSKISCNKSCAVICRDLAMWSYTNHQYISSDYIHFTNEGYNIYANDIVSTMFGGVCGSFLNCYKKIELKDAFEGTLYLCRNDKSITIYSFCKILYDLTGDNNTLSVLPEPFFPDYGLGLWSVPVRVNKASGGFTFENIEISPTVNNSDGTIKLIGNIKRGDNCFINVSIPILACF